MSLSETAPSSHVFAKPEAGLSAASVHGVLNGDNGVTVSVGKGTLELRALSPDAIRVRYYEGLTPDAASFVLVENRPACRFDIAEIDGEIRVSTTKITAVVNRSTGVVSFRDPSGGVFLSESPGGRFWEPVSLLGRPSHRVGQTFDSPEGEKLFGLGQYQDGLWNWRGLPVEMRQLNTQIAVPMLVSSRGYGLLWHNASRTDFNLPGAQVELSPPEESADAKDAPQATEQLTTEINVGASSLRSATFTTTEAGEYVFCLRDGDRRNDIAILVEGRQIAGVTNIWAPRAVVGTIHLPARTTVAVTVRGGGPGVKLFAGLRSERTTFRSDCGRAIDYVVFRGPSIDGVIASYRAATGPCPLWPRWAFGLWQCRERYTSQRHLLDTAKEFRERGIPVDLIIQDWQYWGPHGWGSYEWDLSAYPEPEELVRGLHAMNFRFMISVWCNPHGKAAKELQDAGLLVGEWVDVFSRKGRDIRWEHLNRAFYSIGMDGWWGDATEPGDPGTDLLGKPLSIGAGDEFTSAYPLFASQSLYEGQRSADSAKRVVTLTRSAFPGQQRYAAAAWSGDINGDWEAFRRQLPAGLNFCLTGQPYWTTDCGGFFRPKGQHTSPDFNELLVRWFQWSTFCPILRMHAYQTETEVWKWLPDTQSHLIAYDRLRYRLLPYNYSLAARVTFRGDTFMRALGMDFPEDARAWEISDAHLFGPAFLVAPVTQPKATSREVYLPGVASWIDFWTGETFAGGRTICAEAPLGTLPLFVRAGSIVPMGPDVQYTGEKPADPIELRVYPGADGAFALYEDEGDGYAYEKGAHATIPFRWDERGRTLTLEKREGEFPGMLKERVFRVVLVERGHGVGIEPCPDAVEINYRGERKVVELRRRATQ